MGEGLLEMTSNNADRPIIVTGCARSGTSLVAGVLSHCGAWTGECTGETPWNKRGQFENVFIRDSLTKPFLKSIGVDPLGQEPLPCPGWNLQRHPDDLLGKWRRMVLNRMESEGYDGQRPWMFKGAKACLIWSVWAQAFPEARWIVVRREDSRIIDSCLRAPFMRKRKTREEWQQWVDHHKECFQEMDEHIGVVWEIWPDKAMDDQALGQFQTLAIGLGLKWDQARVTGFVDPQLWSERRKNG